jgi:hypothetical protein
VLSPALLLSCPIPLSHRHSDVSSAGLSGPLPGDWQPPTTTALLDLTGTRALCGGLPPALEQHRLAGSLQVRTAGSGVEQPCVPTTDRALSSPAAEAGAPSDSSAPEGSAAAGGLTGGCRSGLLQAP